MSTSPSWSTFGGGGGGGAVEETDSGTVSSGDAAILGSVLLSDGNTYEVTKATLVLADGQPALTDLNLVIVSLDGNGSGTHQATVLAGDGSTQLVDQTGDPLGSYTNNTGSEQMVGTYVDNGNFLAGTGSDQDTHASVSGSVS